MPVRYDRQSIDRTLYDTSKTLEQLVQSFPIERQKNEWNFRRFFHILIAVVVGGGAVVHPPIFTCGCR